MTPTEFWVTIVNELSRFYIGVVRNVIFPLIDSAMNNIFLLLIFGLIICHIIVGVFKSIL